MQDTAATARTEHGIFAWLGIATTLLALARPIGRFLSWMHGLLLQPIHQRMDRLELRMDVSERERAESKRQVMDELGSLHPKLDAVARAMQRMEIRERRRGPDRDRSIVDDPDFPAQVMDGSAAKKDAA